MGGTCLIPKNIYFKTEIETQGGKSSGMLNKTKQKEFKLSRKQRLAIGNPVLLKIVIYIYNASQREKGM